MSSSGIVTRRKVSARPPREGTGINLRRGAEDDGWHPPQAVALDGGNTAQLLKDGQAMGAAFAAIERARHSVLCEYYTWLNDGTGSRFFDLLERKVAEGVHVFVIYDAFGSFESRKRFDRLARLGAHVGEFHPIMPWKLKFGWRPFNRDHRKLVVVDDHTAFVGGLNIADSYAGRWVDPNVELPDEKLWRDTGLCIRGPAAQMFRRAFSRSWDYILRGGRIARTEWMENIETAEPDKGPRLGRAARYLQRRRHGKKKHKPITPRTQSVGVFAHAPTLSSPLLPLMFRLLNTAKQSIDLTMAYFAPDDALIQHLCEAARRGVRVRLMMAAKSDLTIMPIAARAFYGTLLSAGVEIYERQKIVLHAKTICVDEEISIVGSTNLDYRSIEFNCEISADIHSKAFGRQMGELFGHDIQFSKRIKPDEWQRLPLRDRLVQWFVTRLRYLL